MVTEQGILSYAEVTWKVKMAAIPTPPWFRFKDIPLPSRLIFMINKAPTGLFSSTEWDLATKHFEFALIMKFSIGKPSLHEINLHIRYQWGLSSPVVTSFLDPRHVLILPVSYEDMILVQSHEKHIIETSHFRLFRWTKDFKLGKYSTVVPIWLLLPHLPCLHHNPLYL